jgi:hypothetical protein
VVPLTTVTKALLGTLPHFEDVFWAKRVRRIGGWAVDSPNYDQPFNETSLWIVTRYSDVPAPLDERSGKQITEQRESQAEYITRVYFPRIHGGCVRSGLESAVATEIFYGQSTSAALMLDRYRSPSSIPSRQLP